MAAYTSSGRLDTLGMTAAQTQKAPHKEAKSPTAEEFVDYQREAVDRAAMLVDGHPDVFMNRDGSEKPVLWSYDNPTIHTCERACEGLASIGITEHNRLPLPKYAGDMHKVIEHVHGTLEQRMQQVLWTIDERHDIRFYVATLRSIFFQSITPEMISADVDTLHDTYRAVIARGGDWAPDDLS